MNSVLCPSCFLTHQTAPHTPRKGGTAGVLIRSLQENTTANTLRHDRHAYEPPRVCALRHTSHVVFLDMRMRLPHTLNFSTLRAQMLMPAPQLCPQENALPHCPLLEPMGTTGHVAPILKYSPWHCLDSFWNARTLISHVTVPGLLPWEPLWAPDQPLPFHCVFSPSPDGPAASYPLGLHLSFCVLVSGCSLEIKGPLLPFPLASPLLPHRPLFLAQFIGLWGGNSLGSGSGWEREGQARPGAAVAAT